MGNIGDPILPSIPVVGSAGPQFATDIDTILTEVVARLSTKVPFSSLQVGSSLDLGGQALLNAAYVTLTNTSATPGASPVNRLTAYQGNVYWASPSGVVQMTNGNLLNSAAVGGITGDYGGANPAQLYYDAATTRYNAYANFSLTSLGYVRALGFDIATSATASTYARLAFTGVVNKTFTLPAGFATTTENRPLSIDNTGQIIVGSGSREKHISPAGFSYSIDSLPQTYMDWSYSITDGGLILSVAFPTHVIVPIPMLLGERMLSLTFNIKKVNTNQTNITIYRKQTGAGTTQIGTVSSVTNGNQVLTLTLGTPDTCGTNSTYYLRYGPPNIAAANETFYGFTVTYDQPA